MKLKKLLSDWSRNGLEMLQVNGHAEESESAWSWLPSTKNKEFLNAFKETP